jgi:hypothetical protein
LCQIPPSSPVLEVLSCCSGSGRGECGSELTSKRMRFFRPRGAARILYREWFVDFRFPGHEHVKIIDGLPQGWKSRPLSKCVSFQSGGTPSKSRSEYWSGDIPWISSGELTSTRISNSRYHVTLEAVEAGSRFAEANTILAVVRGMSLAKEFRIGIVAKRVSFNQDVKALVPEHGTFRSIATTIDHLSSISLRKISTLNRSLMSWSKDFATPRPVGRSLLSPTTQTLL